MPTCTETVDALAMPSIYSAAAKRLGFLQVGDGFHADSDSTLIHLTCIFIHSQKSHYLFVTEKVEIRWEIEYLYRHRRGRLCLVINRRISSFSKPKNFDIRLRSWIYFRIGHCNLLKEEVFDANAPSICDTRRRRIGARTVGNVREGGKSAAGGKEEHGDGLRARKWRGHGWPWVSDILAGIEPLDGDRTVRVRTGDSQAHPRIHLTVWCPDTLLTSSIYGGTLVYIWRTLLNKVGQPKTATMRSLTPEVEKDEYFFYIKTNSLQGSSKLNQIFMRKYAFSMNFRRVLSLYPISATKGDHNRQHKAYNSHGGYLHPLKLILYIFIQTWNHHMYVIIAI